jgi:hypothetical protein
LHESENTIAMRRSVGTHKGHPYELFVGVPFMGTRKSTLLLVIVLPRWCNM